MVHWGGGGQTFRQNRSISHHFQGKSIFAFYAEIQAGGKLMFGLPVDSADTLGVKNFEEIALWEGLVWRLDRVLTFKILIYF